MRVVVRESRFRVLSPHYCRVHHESVIRLCGQSPRHFQLLRFPEAVGVNDRLVGKGSYKVP